MSGSERRRRVVGTPDAVEPAVGDWLRALDNCRQRTLTVIAELPDEIVDRPGSDGTTAGSLLHHIAAIEASWLYEEILGQPFPPGVDAVLSFPVRHTEGRLWVVDGESLVRHLERLAVVREALRSTLASMSRVEFHRLRSLPAYDVSPAWVVRHLLQHEAEHRATIASLAGRGEWRV